MQNRKGTHTYSMGFLKNLVEQSYLQESYFGAFNVIRSEAGPER